MKTIAEEVQEQLKSSLALTQLLIAIDVDGTEKGENAEKKAARMLRWLSTTASGRAIALADMTNVFEAWQRGNHA